MCKYPCSIYYNKSECASIVWLVKEISFRGKYDECAVSIRSGADAPNGIFIQVATSLYVQLKYIDIHRAYKIHAILIDQTTDSGGGGGGFTDSLSSKKNI